MDSPQTRFAALLEQHRGIVFKVAATYCRHPEDRQDLAQEIAAQLWRAFSGYDPARLFSTWMYRIALNVAISHVRSTSGRAPRCRWTHIRTRTPVSRSTTAARSTKSISNCARSTQ